ncbi:hypothetical protein CO608_02010 [Lysobacteraceae bacterium NML08-0793]|nr:hypothetical protein CO608_02010 [Xanthomonadaceae bacterium NML08-0793]
MIDSHERKIQNNSIDTYNGAKFIYDDFGNTIHKEFADGRTQNLYYDLFDRLVRVETFKKNAETGTWEKEVWKFEYDALDRRIAKCRELSDGLKADETEFVWDESRLLQEVYKNGRYTYIYTDQDSYEPLAQIHNYTNAEYETFVEWNYFHCDQIGIPREMTDKDGRLLWFGEYDAWGKLVKETNVTGTAHQPFRLQNQYCDRETELHYNFFRYYDPDVGRFVNQDPIGLWGGENLYQFALNMGSWIGPLGLAASAKVIKFDTFEQAMNAAMDWLEKRGFKAEKTRFGKFGNIKDKPVGMQTADGKCHFRIEFDDRHGAHINVQAGKEKGSHFVFKASEKTVTKIQRTFGKKGWIIMYDYELLDFFAKDKICFSEISEESYETYSDMKNFPFVGSRINWKNLENHICENFENSSKFIEKIRNFICQNNFIQLILIGYDFEKGYLLKISINDIEKIVSFLTEYPGENYLIDINEKWCICIYDYLDFGMTK